MKKITILLLSSLMMVFTACSGSKAGGGSDAGCVAPSKTYGEADVDNFLKTAYDVCKTLEEANEVLTEANEFAANPEAYIAKKGAQAKSQLRSKVNAWIKDIPKKVLTPTLNALKDAGNATSGVKNIKGMNAISAAKDVKNAVSNLKSISENAPKVLEQLSSLASKLS